MFRGARDEGPFLGCVPRTYVFDRGLLLGVTVIPPAVTATSGSGEPAAGLRERKRARTRETIRRSALALFDAQGYAATTVAQIVDAADVSESTFFRYFPTKQDVVLSDELDLPFDAALRSQPKHLELAAALRAAMREVIEGLSAEELSDLRDRVVMVVEVPELWRAALVRLSNRTDQIAGLVAERLRGDPQDPGTRAFAGAMMGALTTLMRLWAENPHVDLLTSIDTALEFFGPIPQPDECAR